MLSVSTDRMVCLYISRYAPERSPSDPYMALPLYLSQHTDFIGLWGVSRRLDAGFVSSCRKIMEFGSGWLGWLKAAKCILKMKVCERAPDFVVCGVDEFSLCLGLIAARCRRLPLFCVVEDPPFTSRYESHRSRYRTIERRARSAILRRLLQNCQGIFCFIEKEILQEYRVSPQKIFQVMNAASPRALQWAESRVHQGAGVENSTVAFVGAIESAQGIDELIEIFAKAKEQVPGLHMRLIGPVERSYASGLQSKLESLGVLGAVEFTGWLPYEKMLEKLEPCIAGVYCSPPTDWYRNAQPLKVCEYLALRKPTVAWDYPGVRHLLDNGRLGILVPPGDKQAFASALADLTDEIKRRKMEREIGSSLHRGWDNRYWYGRVLQNITSSVQGRRS